MDESPRRTPALGGVRKRLDSIHHRGFEEDVRGFIEQAAQKAFDFMPWTPLSNSTSA